MCFNIDQEKKLRKKKLESWEWAHSFCKQYKKTGTCPKDCADCEWGLYMNKIEKNFFY